MKFVIYYSMQKYIYICLIGHCIFCLGCSAPPQQIEERPIYILEKTVHAPPDWAMQLQETRLVASAISGMKVDNDSSLILYVFSSSGRVVDFKLNGFVANKDRVDNLMLYVSQHANSPWKITSSIPAVDEQGRLVCDVFINTGLANRSLALELMRATQ
jgi:hypothetical protein